MEFTRVDGHGCWFFECYLTCEQVWTNNYLRLLHWFVN